MNRRKMQSKISYIMLTVVALAFTGCAFNTSVDNDLISSETGFIVTKAGMYDSTDEAALILGVDSDKKTITFYNRDLNKRYTLNYDGTSKLYDKYGSALSMEQIEPGKIADITFLKGKKQLNSLTMSPNAWVYEQAKDFQLSEENHELILPTGTYKFDDSLAVYSGGKEAQLMDINPVDIITVCGVDRVAYSINIDQGHGYLRLKNEDYFVGGWIEVGSKIIRTIGEDMLLAVPIGTYDVLLSTKGAEGTKNVTINCNEETELDIGDLKTEELVTYGKVVMVTTPSDAEVYIDGQLVDTTGPVEMEYGIHQMIARASGYQTLTQYIKVGQESATLDITLEKEKEKKDTTVAMPSPIPTAAVSPYVVSPANNTNVEGHKVTVSSPTDVEVYLDGSYIGIAPISFAKNSGKHEITLRKEGFVTRSYTVTIDASSQDENFGFSDLQKSE